jgi:tRNA dimethylallyltransferase
MPDNNRTKIRSNTFVVGLSIPRAELRKRIYDRVQQMMDDGILDEVRAIGEQFGWQSEAMTANIYRIFAEVIQGKKRVGEAMAEAAQADIYLAKRQRTWFKRNRFIQWYEGSSDAKHAVEQFLASRI